MFVPHIPKLALRVSVGPNLPRSGPLFFGQTQRAARAACAMLADNFLAGIHLMSAPLRLSIDVITQSCPERDVLARALPLDGCRIIELGCGRADLTRAIALGGTGRAVLALEVDEIQHAKNAQIDDLQNVEFKLGGAESIPAADASFDVACMFKSLHHVPLAEMDTALHEIARVLKPGGLAWLSEPIFAGPFNEILRLFHDEQQVRDAAFAAISRAVVAGLFVSVEEIFFNAPMHFPDFAAFERQIIGVTHTRHVLTPAVHAEVRRRFEACMGPDGARFEAPMRVNLLRRR